MSDKVVTVVKIKAAPGKVDRVAEILDKGFAGVQNEQGTEIYIMCQDKYSIIEGEQTNAPDEVWFCELFTNQSAVDAHGENPVILSVIEELDGLLAEPFELIRMTPVRALGVEL